MKTNVLLVFGGRSSEHEISRISAGTIARALDPEKYNVHYPGGPLEIYSLPSGSD